MPNSIIPTHIAEHVIQNWKEHTNANRYTSTQMMLAYNLITQQSHKQFMKHLSSSKKLPVNQALREYYELYMALHSYKMTYIVNKKSQDINGTNVVTERQPIFDTMDVLFKDFSKPDLYISIGLLLDSLNSYVIHSVL
jgi:hypothetical protein